MSRPSLTTVPPVHLLPRRYAAGAKVLFGRFAITRMVSRDAPRQTFAPLRGEKVPEASRKLSRPGFLAPRGNEGSISSAPEQSVDRMIYLFQYLPANTLKVVTNFVIAESDYSHTVGV